MRNLLVICVSLDHLDIRRKRVLFGIMADDKKREAKRVAAKNGVYGLLAGLE